MTYWLGVVQREHVLRGMSLGIAQTSHGARSGIQRMHAGDGLVYYSPKTAYPTGDRLRQFTAIGTIAPGEPWQEEEGQFTPWRRAVEYDTTAVAAPIEPLLDVLDLTRGNRNWGLVMRRGQVELSEQDFRTIAREMGSALAAVTTRPTSAS
jgi:hypothetical protein